MKTSKAQAIYLALADDRAHGRLPPGTLLDEVEIAHRVEVSRTSIREALRHLKGSGLAEGQPNRGALVRAISERQIDDMFAVVAELACVARQRVAPFRHAQIRTSLGWRNRMARTSR